MLQTFNRSLTEQGYSTLSEEQWRLACEWHGEELFAWVGAFLMLGKSSKSWPMMQATLMCLSPKLTTKLEKSGIRLDMATVVKRLHAEPALFRLAKAVITDKASAREFALAVSRKVGIDQGRIHKVYASAYAATFESTTSSSGLPAFQVEVAAKGGSGFDWASKLSIQLSESETSLFYAVLNGWLSILEVTNHGAERNKHLTFRTQEGTPGWFLSVRRGREARVLPVPISSGHKLLALTSKVLLQGSPHLDLASLRDSIRCAIGGA